MAIMQWKADGNQYVIRLDGQEPVIHTLKEFSRQMEVGSASLHGIGGLEKVKYGIFDPGKGSYSKYQHDSFAELISLSGNITWVEQDPFIHCHFLAALGPNQFIGGHLFEANASITVELFIRPSNEKIQRKYDSEAHFKVMQLPNSFKLSSLTD